MACGCQDVVRWKYCVKQAQDNVLFSGKIEEYEAAFSLVDPEKKGDSSGISFSITILQQEFCLA